MSVVSRSPLSLLDEAALVERILDHVDRGTTDLAERTWQEPVANYTSEVRLRQEVEARITGADRAAAVRGASPVRTPAR